MYSTFSAKKTPEGINPELYHALQRHNMLTEENINLARELCKQDGWNNPLLSRMFGTISPEKLASAGFAKPNLVAQPSH